MLTEAAENRTTPPSASRRRAVSFLELVTTMLASLQTRDVTLMSPGGGRRATRKPISLAPIFVSFGSSEHLPWRPERFQRRPSTTLLPRYEVGTVGSDGRDFGDDHHGFGLDVRCPSCRSQWREVDLAALAGWRSGLGVHCPSCGVVNWSRRDRQGRAEIAGGHQGPLGSGPDPGECQPAPGQPRPRSSLDFPVTSTSPRMVGRLHRRVKRSRDERPERAVCRHPLGHLGRHR